MKRQFFFTLSMSCLLAIMLATSCYKDALTQVGCTNCDTSSFTLERETISLTVDNWIAQGHGQFVSDIYAAAKKYEPHTMSISAVTISDDQSYLHLTNGQPTPYGPGSLTWTGRNLTLSTDGNSGPASNYSVHLLVGILYSNNQ